MWDLRQAAELLGASLIRPRAPFVASGAACDSRQVEPGQVFVALRGKRHDGHEFLAEAFSRGAVGALVSRDEGHGHNLLLVDDVEGALWELASWRRDGLAIPFVGVAGSFGKTTAKELAAAALSVRYRVFRARASYNTEIGVPLEILSVPSDAEVAVLELGEEAPGDIRRLAELVRPWAGFITGVGEAHLAGLGDLEGVAGVLWELAEALPEEGVLALNWDSPQLRARAVACQGVCVRFGSGPQADFYPRQVVADSPQGVTFLAVTPRGELRVGLKLLGEHVATLACGALALAWSMGVPEEAAARALGKVRPLPHRLELLPAPFGWILDDCYNANPLSVRAALKALVSLELPVERRAALLGDMLDLGPEEARYHREVVEEARWQGVDVLFAYGPRMSKAFSSWGGPGAAEPEDLDALLEKVRQELSRLPTLLLVKGSRGMALERAVAALA
ncbi:UDP-N-acetylmuramoyl-tripeptide--D-alanyl-D-alanine ligase [Candidatus Bipolaricaulota bacterium]|nr:UDP-N-acetylmuramoyl-tripeptide--D-alanyl-D-alanine ligase [Candidatus Bipolaricaulota bacterium]